MNVFVWAIDKQACGRIRHRYTLYNQGDVFREAGRFNGGQTNVPGDFANVHSLDAGEMLIPI